MKWCLMSLDVGWHITYLGQAETNAETWCNTSLRPRKPEGLLGWTAQDGHLDSHSSWTMIMNSQVTTTPELWTVKLQPKWHLYSL